MDRHAHEYDEVMGDLIEKGEVIRTVSESGLVQYTPGSRSKEPTHNK